LKINTAYLLLGSNLGERLVTIQKAFDLIELKIGIIVTKSSIYETEPWGNTNQPAFLNQVIKIETKLHPIDVLQHILKIEKELGRTRTEHWGARTIDIDILYYADIIMKMTDLIIPHPHIQQRRFTLAPLAEIAPSFMHPVLKQSNQELLNNCQDTSDLQKL
jgi:2-amino-4-hydroxy-6-hydroxymethyldihydropteridine diphosphokinase